MAFFHCNPRHHSLAFMAMPSTAKRLRHFMLQVKALDDVGVTHFLCQDQGVPIAYSDSVPMLILPLGHQRDRAQVFPLFSSARTYASVTKSVETLNQPEQVSEVMRRAFNLLKMGRPGPVMVEIPADVALEEVDDAIVQSYRVVKPTYPAGNPQDIAEAATVLLQARKPVIHAGQGVLYAEASAELEELAELLQIPVMTTLEGKSAFPEDHPLSLGTGSGVMAGPVYHF